MLISNFLVHPAIQKAPKTCRFRRFLCYEQLFHMKIVPQNINIRLLGSFSKNICSVSLFREKPGENIIVTKRTELGVMRVDENNMLIRKRLGENIRKCRVQRGLTQLELADAAGFGEEHCKQVEYGNKALSIYNLCAVAKVLNVSTDYLLFGSTKESELENIFHLLDDMSVKQLEYVEKMILLFRETME